MYVYIKQLGIVCLLCWLGLSCTLQRTEHPALRQAGYLDGRTFRQCVFIIEIHLFPNRYEPGRQGRLRFAAG